MSLMTPAEYVESLRDGRVTYWDGERIDDITSHTKFKTPIAVASSDNDYANPARREVMTYRAEDGGLAHRVFQIPRSAADLEKRIELMHDMSIVGGVTGVFMALMSVKDAVAEVSPQYAENIERMYRYVRDNDLRAAEVITDPKGDRSRRAHEQDDPDLYVRIVKRTDEGIVVRGAKLHITAASLVHELVVMPTKGMRQDETDYAVSFSIPVNAKGVSIINRSFAQPELNEFDYPASGHHSMPEGFVVFDDVFVPWDRVFLAGEVQLASRLAQSLGLWERTGGLVGAVGTSRLFVGLGQLVTEMQGKERDANCQNTVAELICYAEMLRMGLDFACRNYETTPSGMIHPNTLAVNTAKYYYAANYHDAVKRLHDLAGGLVLTAALGGRSAQRGLRALHPQVPGDETRRRCRDADAGLQPDPRPDRRRLRRLASGGRPASRWRTLGAAGDDEPHLRHGRREGCGAGGGGRPGGAVDGGRVGR